MTPADEIEDAPAELGPDAARIYLDARARGLCHDGAMEVALGAAPVATDPRLETVEVKIAHLEKAVQELSDVLYRQQRQLDAVVAINEQLLQQIAESEHRATDPTTVEVPPHY